MRHILPAVAFVLFPLSLHAQGGEWNERLDSSVVESRLSRVGISLYPISQADLRRTASPVGEADLVKFVQTLPGVSTGMEGSSAYYVRGGNGGNNMTTLDGIPVYGPGHLLGLTTAYPAEIVGKNEFYAGGFPSDMGGFTSSLLRLTSLEGDFRKATGSVSINNFLVGTQASAPLKKDRASVLASVRVSPLGLEYNLLAPHLDPGLNLPDRMRSKVGYAFMKVAWKGGNGDKVYLSVLGTHDSYGYDADEQTSNSLGWSNLVASLTWTREARSGWKWEAGVSSDGFRAFQDQKLSYHKDSKPTRMSIQSSLREEGIRAKASRLFSGKLHVMAGTDLFRSEFHPGVTKGYLGKGLSTKSGSSLSTIRGSVYGEADYRNGPLQIRSGLRATGFVSDGYNSCKPTGSLTASYGLSPSLTAKATYDHAVQFFHSLEGIPTGWSMEMLIPPSGSNRPETADQVCLGLEFSRKSFSISAGTFYKYMRGLVIYSDASAFFSTGWKEWQDNLESGYGHSYGAEFLARVDVSRFSGQLSYTLSKTDRVFEGLNFGHPFPFKFDRRHILSYTGELKLRHGEKASHSFTTGVSWMSGHWESVASGTYDIHGFGQESILVDYTSHPNNLRLPAYFRMDAGYHLSLQGGKSLHDISLGVYNLTNRHNAYSLNWDKTDERWKKLCIFPILPNFSYRITFGRK